MSFKKFLYMIKYTVIMIRFLLFTSIFLIIFGAITYKNENIIKNKKASIMMLRAGSIILGILILTPILLIIFK